MNKGNTLINQDMEELQGLNLEKTGKISWNFLLKEVVKKLKDFIQNNKKENKKKLYKINLQIHLMKNQAVDLKYNLQLKQISQIKKKTKSKKN